MGNQTDTESGKKDNPCECKEALEKYKITLEFLKFEATTLWQIYNSFFVGHAIFMSIVLTELVKNENKDLNFVVLLIAGLIGLLLAILWFGTFHGNGNWYDYRMKQSKDAEKCFVRCNNDDKWFLLNGDAEKFADRQFKNRYGAYTMIVIFILIYLSIILFSFIKLNSNC